ncbi:MAG: hypothetical protein A2033_01885 [Bacteroidetes bacterium GWA2_31_9]|nr:MAG: hypothetical protein A2033_01885 [Bacteroidetes bacterium GWA2_31_9]
MKNIIILLVALLSFETTNSNPIFVAPSPILNELYFNGNNWEMELIFHNYAYFYIDNLDSIRIITSTDTAMLKTTISLQFEQIVVITQDSLMSNLFININGDIIRFQHFNNGWGDLVDPVVFGNFNNGINNSYVNAPKTGQGLAMINIGGDYNPECFLILENNHTIGFPNDNYTNGIFSGRIVDLSHNPICKKSLIHCKMNFYNDFHTESSVPENFIYPFYTDTNGIFYQSNFYTRNFTVKLLIDSLWLFDTSFAVTIEPDSINYYEFLIDTNQLIFVNVERFPKNTNFSLTAFPNPSKNETTISFELPSNNLFAKALIKIYNSNGEIVSILPVETNTSQNKYSVKWESLNYNLTTSGIYYYILELDGQNVATNKIIISK